MTRTSKLTDPIAVSEGEIAEGETTEATLSSLAAELEAQKQKLDTLTESMDPDRVRDIAGTAALTVATQLATKSAEESALMSESLQKAQELQEELNLTVKMEKERGRFPKNKAEILCCPRCWAMNECTIDTIDSQPSFIEGSLLESRVDNPNPNPSPNPNPNRKGHF